MQRANAGFFERREKLLTGLLVAVALLATSGTGRLLAPLCLGAAAAQNPPLVLCFPLLLAAQAHQVSSGEGARADPFTRSSGRRWRDSLPAVGPLLWVSHVGGLLLAGAAMIWWERTLGALSGVTAVGGASLDYFS